MAPLPTHSDLPGAVVNRRRLITGLGASAAALALGMAPLAPIRTADATPLDRPRYAGPNVIIIRFGGGVRRRETIDPRHTYSSYLLHQLVPRGMLFPNMRIADAPGVDTSHGQGTLNILTGKYKGYDDVNPALLGERFEANVPTLFEYLRKAYAVPAEQTLLINGENRIDEEFYTFSAHHHFGVRYRSHVLSIYRFKRYLLEQQLATKTLRDQERKAKEKALAKMKALDYRVGESNAPSAKLQAFWGRWRDHHGESGLRHARGDRALTALCLRAMRELRPKLIMVNYNDCDYVHWGYLSHYTRGIQIMDAGLQQIVAAVETDAAYRDNTVIVVVPDCGRDNNRFVAVPCQHHFNTRSAREIFALFVGPGIPQGKVIDRSVEQTSVAATLGALMRCPTPFAEGPVLQEVIA